MEKHSEFLNFKMKTNICEFCSISMPLKCFDKVHLPSFFFFSLWEHFQRFEMSNNYFKKLWSLNSLTKNSLYIRNIYMFGVHRNLGHTYSYFVDKSTGSVKQETVSNILNTLCIFPWDYLTSFFFSPIFCRTRPPWHQWAS